MKRITSISIYLFSAFLLCGLTTVKTPAAPGDLDPTFGSGGKVFSTVTGMDPTRGMALQPDGKIIIVGSVLGADSTQDFLVIRLNADGTRDTQFGTNGVVRVPFDDFANEFASCAGTGGREDIGCRKRGVWCPGVRLRTCSAPSIGSDRFVVWCWWKSQSQHRS